MQQRLMVWCFAICIIAVLYVWTCAQSTPQNSFGELASAIKQSNSGKFDELVDQSEIAQAASKDIIPDQMTKQAGPAGVSFAQYRMLLYQNIASQISALGKVSTPESAQGGYKFVKDESITQPAQQVVKNYLSKHPDSAIARVLLDSGRSGDHLSALLTKYGITAENFRGAGPINEYDRKGIVLTGHCCSTELKFFDPNLNKETIVKVEFEREHGLLGDRGVGLPPLFKPDAWILRRVLNLPEIISTHEPDFIPYMQANAVSANSAAGASATQMTAQPITTTELKSEGKKLWKKLKDWAKD